MATVRAATLEGWLDDLLSEPIAAAQERARTAFDREVESCGKRFVLFGAGNMGRRILARLRKDGIEPLAFSDNQSGLWGGCVDGLDVISPVEAATRYGSDAAFIVTIYNNRHSFPRTRDQLFGLGCRKVASVIPLRWKYCETFLPYFHDDLPHKVVEQRGAIRDAFELWFDEPSRREFVAQVSWRLNGDFDVLAKPDPEHEYFPGDLIRLREDECFVDVGAYDGDSIRRFLAFQGGKFHRVIALEPDTHNYARLLRNLAELPPEIAMKIEARALAASNRTCRLRFSVGEGEAAALCDQGSIEVDCVSLDQFLDSRHPTYIKMDIEGAELDAIEGCKQVLTRDRPVFAVCVYHTQDHLWKVPLAVGKTCPQYRYHLRSHMESCWDTVCYAVPPDRVQ